MKSAVISRESLAISVSYVGQNPLHRQPSVEHDSEMPPLLGWHDFLEKAPLFTNYITGEAWLEWPDESTASK
jgi:hypothetical protein